MADAKELWWKLNKATDESGATGEKHAPHISIDGEVAPGKTVAVTVDVGRGKHPNEAAHSIQWVELQANGLYIGRAEFAAGITQPIATFQVAIPYEGEIVLTALGRCNLHGIWESNPVTLA